MRDYLKEFNLDHWTADWLLTIGVAEKWVSVTALGIDVIILVFFAWLADLIAKRVILRVIEKAVARTETDLDDVLVEKRVFDALLHIAPAIVINLGAPYVFSSFPEFLPWVAKAVNSYIIITVVWFISSVLNALYDFSQRSSYFRDKPILSYVQVGKLVSYIIAGILLFSVLFEKSPFVVLSAFGAIAAVLLFVFKDAILGLVASIQISANDMLRVGDWVTMEKYQADGDVIRITLTTIVVQNWDKTLTTIPSYAFVSDSFKNWRGMSDSGGRRIKRTILINASTVRFCDQEMLERFSRFELLSEYIASRSKEIEEYNADRKADKTYPINGRHMTNLGVFRKYIENYISASPRIHQGMTMMVRQLEPSEFGIPMEVYCFTATTGWIEYEGIQSDLFDHFIAAAPLFDLKVFQRPSGYDFKAAN